MKKISVLVFGLFILTQFSYAKPFIITVKIDKSYDFDIYTLYRMDRYDFSVDWGDGSGRKNISYEQHHKYTRKGTYKITISGKFPALRFTHLGKNGGIYQNVMHVTQWGDNQWTSMEGMFEGCVNLKIMARDTPNISGVTNMSKMFSGVKVNNFNLSQWDVSRVVNMSEMFKNNRVLTPKFSNWNTSSVKNMEGMFDHANLKTDISQWNVRNVENMNNMFRSSGFNGDISNWNTINVTHTEYMFAYSKFNGNISQWNVASVEVAVGMFKGNTSFTQSIRKWKFTTLTHPMNCLDFAKGSSLTCKQIPKKLVKFNETGCN